MSHFVRIYNFLTSWYGMARNYLVLYTFDRSRLYWTEVNGVIGWSDFAQSTSGQLTGVSVTAGEMPSGITIDKTGEE